MFWLFAISLSGGIIFLLFKLLVNTLGDLFISMWYIIEFQFYKKEFKEWVKSKERIPRIQRENDIILLNDLYEEIKHGDDDHKKWLKDRIDQFVKEHIKNEKS